MSARTGAIPPAAPAASREAARYRSPLVGALRVARYPLIGASVLWLAAGAFAVRETGDVVRSVGRDGTSVEAAQRIGTGVARAHGAFLASVVAARSGAVPADVPSRGLDEVVTSLTEAAGNVTSPGEREALTNLSLGIGHYDDATARAESPDPVRAAKALRAANAIASELIQASDGLSAMKDRHLFATWNVRADGFGWWLFALVTVVLLGAMLYAQVEMALRTNRLLNAFMAPATLVVAVVSVLIAGDLSRATSDMRVAKKDAFDSIDATWRARSLAARAHDAVIGSVLDVGDPARQATDARAFANDATIVMPDEGRVAEALSVGGRLQGVGGLVGAELANVTFPGEGDAARAMARTCVDMVKADRSVLADVSASGEADPAALATREAGALRSADEVHERFDAAVVDVVRINHEAFATSVVDAEHAMDGLLEWLVTATLTAAALSYLGFRQRLDEYGR